MASANTFRCQLITPEAALLDAQVTSAVLPAHDGEIGILLHRAPLLCKLGSGEMRVTVTEGVERFFVDGGFAHVVDDVVTVLAPRAIPAGKIDTAAVERELAELQASSAHGIDHVAQRAQAIQRATAKLRVAAKDQK